MQSLGVMLDGVSSLRRERDAAPRTAEAAGSQQSDVPLIDVGADGRADGPAPSPSSASPPGASGTPIVVGGIDVLRVESMSSLPREVCRKVLQRDYSLIIETTPLHAYPLPLLDAECDTTVVGLPGIELQLPWTKIALQEYARAGPVTLVIPAGTRLLELPEPLQGAEFVALWPWSCKGGPSSPKVVPARSGLPILNGYLVSHAVMAQRLAPSVVDAGGRQPCVRTASIPLPVRRGEGGGMLAFRGGTWQAMEIGVEETDGASSHVRGLIDGLALNNVIGVLEVALEEEGGRWVPHDLFLGIPLYLTKLCRTVIGRALEEGVFTVEGLARYKDTVSRIRTSVRRLIAAYALGDEGEGGAWGERQESAQPRAAVLVVDGAVKEYPISKHAQGGLTLQEILYYQRKLEEPVEPGEPEGKGPPPADAVPSPTTPSAPAESLI